MAVQIRWRRVGAATLAVLMSAGVSFGAMVPNAFWYDVPDLHTFERLRDQGEVLTALEQRLQRGDDYRVLDEALTAWEDARDLRNQDTLISVSVGALLGIQAAGVVEQALMVEPSPEVREHVRVRLQALTDPLDQAAVIAREKEDAWTLLGESLRKGRLDWVAGWLLNHHWTDMSINHPETFEKMVLTAEQERRMTVGLIWMVALQQQVATAGVCSDELAGLGEASKDLPHVYDAQRCEVALVVHPDHPPMVIHGR